MRKGSVIKKAMLAVNVSPEAEIVLNEPTVPDICL